MSGIAEILAQMCAAPGPAGFEQPVAEQVRELLARYMDETRIDVLGNAIGARRKFPSLGEVPPTAAGRSPTKLLIDAHIDEIGLIITSSEEGFLRFATLGSVDPRILPATCVEILAEPPMHGVICAMPPHLVEKDEASKAIKIDDMYIDAGLSKDEAKKSVPPGTPVVLGNRPRRLGETSFCGKALDNRAGLTAVLRCLELLQDKTLDVDLYVMASVQEEVGTRGATTGGYAIDPDWCIVIDAGHAKTPDTKPTDTENASGGGVIISRGPNMNSRLTEALIDIAQKNDIKHQVDVEPGGNSGTNAHAIQISRAGVATALLSIPVKYMHSAYECLTLDDIESAAQLLCAAVMAYNWDGHPALPRKD